MTSWVDSFIIMLVMADFMLLATNRLYTGIAIIAFQGVLLGILPLIIEPHLSIHAALLSIVMIALKGIIFPRLLKSAIRQTNTKQEMEPYIGYIHSLFIGLATLALSIWISSKMPPIEGSVSHIAMPAAIFTVFCGLFVIVSRKKALTQVLGYLTMENGIYAFGVLCLLEESLLVELSALLDLLVGVFLMGVIVFHISRTFDHIDTDQLSKLHDRIQSP